jgi:hypothetical protein
MDILQDILVLFGIGLVIAVLISLAGAVLGVLGLAAAGALTLLSFASAQGFVGLAAYVACWVFMSPVMLTASVIVGWITHSAERVDDTASSAAAQLSSEEQAAAWQEEDARYEEHRRRLIKAAQVNGVAR